MQSKHKFLKVAAAIACCSYAFSAQAVLPSSDVRLTINTGSNFGMEVSPGSWLDTQITGLNHIVIGTAQAASGSHSGSPDGSESPDIDNPWLFFGNTGMHQTTSAVTIIANGSTTVTLNFSGWNVTWNGIPSIPMGDGPDAGVATITCGTDCSYGDSYTLSYLATVPDGDPSGFGNVNYRLNLTGNIESTNIPPVANSFSANVLENTVSTINLLPHVSDSDDGIDTGSVVISNDNSCGTGTVTENGDGTVDVPACTAGIYTFDYTISDNFGDSDTATVTVNVSADPPPNASPDAAATNGTTPVVIDVAANDSDAHLGGGLDLTSVAISSAPEHGSTSINGTTGEITYTANTGFSGVEIFTYTIDDNAAQPSDPAEVTVTVSAMNFPSTSDTFTPGNLAQSVGSTTGVITAADIGIEDRETNRFDVVTIVNGCIGGCFDFTISGLANGGTTQVVLPLSEPIPAPAEGNNILYRIFNTSTGEWFSFDRSGADDLHTVAGTVSGSDIICPSANDPSYDATAGLNPGDRCVRLTIVDGGPNDTDGLANGTVVDPSGVAEVTRTRISSTDGCSMNGNSANLLERADWLLLTGFMVWLGLLVRRKQA